jgi:hypothetical protein
MDFLSPQTLSVIGAALALLGGVILFLDLHGNKIQEAVRNVEIHMGRLQQQIDDMDKKPIPRGEAAVQGQDLGEIFEIMRDGAKMANEKNTDIRLELLEKVNEQLDKHRRAEGLANFLVIFGGLLQLVASQIN